MSFAGSSGTTVPLIVFSHGYGANPAEALIRGSGDWVLRLRKGYERAQFPSAASDALAEVVARELAQLMERARRSTARAPAAAAAATASVVAP